MNSCFRSKFVFGRFAAAAVFALLGFAAISNAQGITQANKAQVAASEAYDNRRIQDGMEKDKAAARSKEERMAVVNEAFKRLQLLHNELMTMMSSAEAVENAKIASAVEEVRLRASQLNANLALPELPKSKSEKGTELPDAPLKDQLSNVCSEIRAFVKNVNLSPTDPKAGLQARRDLKMLMERSDQILNKLASPAKA
jgi:hypothetical protein